MTYGDSLAQAMNGSSADGTGLWALFVLLLAVVALTAAMVVLVRTVKSAIDAV